MVRLIIRIIGLLIICCLSSCATMTRWFDSYDKNHEMYTVTIKSRTKGLPVYYSNDGKERLAGYTPCELYSDKAKIKYITVKNGDVYQTVKLKRRGRKSTYWNFVPYYTFIWGYFVDQHSGRGRTYSDKEYYVDL